MIRKAVIGLVVLLTLSFASLVFAQDKPVAEKVTGDAKAEVEKVKSDSDGYKVFFPKAKVSKKYLGIEKLAGDFLLNDKRFKIVKSAKQADFSLAISVKGKKTTKLKIHAVTNEGGEETYEKDLGKKPAVLVVVGEVRRGLRQLFVYKPARRKALVKIVATAEGQDTDAGQVEMAAWDVLRPEYDEVMADPYKLPVKNAQIAKIVKKEDKKLIKKFKENGVDLLIVGTIKLPKIKDVGGAASNMYKGTMSLELKAINTSDYRLYSYLKSDFTGKGQYSELLFNLMDGAAKHVGEGLFNELGFPRVEAEEDEAPDAEDEEEGTPGHTTFE